MAKKRNTRRRSRRNAELTASDVSGFFTTLLNRFIAGVFSTDKKEPWRRHVRRLCIGAAGGVFYACLRNFVNEGIGVVGLLTMEPGSRRAELFFGYCVAAAMSAAAGGVTAWLSVQKSGRLLFLIGMLGVSILLGLFPNLQSKGGKTVGWSIEESLPITPAHAENEEKCVGSSAFNKGFKAFFGVREHYDRYAVVVASGKNLADANSKLKAIHAEDQNVKLHVGPRACDNDFYPVFASDYLSLSEAKMILEKVRRLKTAPDAYLSPGPLE